MPDVEGLTLPGLTVVRDWHMHASLRAADQPAPGTLGQMDVRFSQFDVWYRIDSFWEGSFMERTVPGAFKRTFDAHNAARNDDAHNIKTLFNHGMDFNIGDKILGSIESVSEQDDGPVSVVNLFDTSYNRDLEPGLRAGVYGSSFMFRVVQDEWNNEPGTSKANPDGLPERTIREAKVYEAGPVTFPASPTASAGMRCLSGTDAFYEHAARSNPVKIAEMRSRLTALRSAGPAEGTPVAAGPAEEPPTDPASSHSARMTATQRRERLYPYLRGTT